MVMTQDRVIKEMGLLIVAIAKVQYDAAQITLGSEREMSSASTELAFNVGVLTVRTKYVQEVLDGFNP
jgi:hypothetical protein